MSGPPVPPTLDPRMLFFLCTIGGSCVIKDKNVSQVIADT